MPLIIVEGPVVDVEVKRKLVHGLTRAAEEAYGVSHIIVLIKENPADNVGTDGQLLSDRHRAASTDVA